MVGTLIKTNFITNKVKITLYYQNVPYNPIKKMNTHTLCFCLIIIVIGVGKSEVG